MWNGPDEPSVGVRDAQRARQRPERGVRLSSLDRTRVYRIGYTGRRWEVLGPDPEPASGGAPEREAGPHAGAGRVSGEPRSGPHAPGRHRAPDTPPVEPVSGSQAEPPPR